MNRETALRLLAIVAIAGACSPDETRSNGSLGVASMHFALVGEAIIGASVRICGSRPAPDSATACEAALPSIPACPCYAFDAEGGLIDPDTRESLVVRNLCPSSDPPAADWTFSYAIFENADCTGTQLNDGDNNLVCFDSSDLIMQMSPNRSAETLAPGTNQNHIVCLSEAGAKNWNFQTCAVTTPSDFPEDVATYDCGCMHLAGTCSCGEGGVNADDLPTGCQFDATCHIVCGTLPVEGDGAEDS